MFTKWSGILGYDTDTWTQSIYDFFDEIIFYTHGILLFSYLAYVLLLSASYLLDVTMVNLNFFMYI
jgi:hypothetical protein